MSKENALRFMMIKDKDDAIKAACNSIIGKYEGKDLTKQEWESVTQEEVIPLAKKYGYDFTLEDLAECQIPDDRSLSDQELGDVTGGYGEMAMTYRNRYRHIITYTAYCDYAPDDETFFARYNRNPPDCPDYVWSGSDNPAPLCTHCANYKIKF